MNRILERLSDQLSIRHGEQAHSSAPSEPSRLSSSPCTDQDKASDSSHFTNESLRSMMNGAGHISNYSDSHSSTELLDHSASREWFDGGQSVLSQLIGRASDIGSSQVFDQSSALASGLQEVTQSTGNVVRLWCASLPVCFIALTVIVLLQLQAQSQHCAPVQTVRLRSGR